MDVGLLTAFLGGMLAILSPCGALLLPAFFASTVGSGPRLLLHGAVFYIGLLLVLVPLGIGVGALGSLFVSQRSTIIVIASILMVVFGIMMIFGIGFDTSKLFPGSQALQTNAASSVGLVKSFLLGATSGLAGFCAGPILGAVLTMAAAKGDVLGAGVLLAFYAAGMVVPLVLIALLWNKLGERGRRVLRGKTLTLWRREFHTTSVAAGVLMIVVGILFWRTNGLVTMPDLLPPGVSALLQSQGSILSSVWVDVGVVILLAFVALLIWWRSVSKKQDEGISENPESGPLFTEVSGVVGTRSKDKEENPEK